MLKISQMEYSFNLYNTLAPDAAALALKKIININNYAPVILCIGSDLSVGDSLGPIVGTRLKEQLNSKSCYIYGTLDKPVTAKEVKYINTFLANTHPQSPIIAVDAAVGAAGDIGLVKIISGGVKPGSGANKKLGRVGNASIIGIVAEKSIFNYSLLSSTRLNIVYKMADLITKALNTYISDYLQTITLNNLIAE